MKNKTSNEAKIEKLLDEIYDLSFSNQVSYQSLLGQKEIRATSTNEELIETPIEKKFFIGYGFTITNK